MAAYQKVLGDLHLADGFLYGLWVGELHHRDASTRHCQGAQRGKQLRLDCQYPFHDWVSTTGFLSCVDVLKISVLYIPDMLQRGKE